MEIREASEFRRLLLCGRRPSTTRSRLALVVGVLVLACSDGMGPPPPPPPPGVTIVGTPLRQDTIDARPTLPLVFLVRDSTGAAAPGMSIRFLAVYGTYLPPDCCGIEQTMRFRLPAQTSFTTEVVTAVGTDGQVELEVEFGRHAGDGGIVILVPALGVTDTVAFTIQPGEPVEMEIAAPDTAVMLGHLLSWPEALIRDRWMNVRSDPVSFTIDGVLEPAAGGALANVIGTGRVFAVAGEFKDTMSVTVVPEGMLAAYFNFVGIVVANLDGTSRRTLVPGASVTSAFGGMAWTPDGARLLFRDESNWATRLDHITLAGARSTLPVPDSLHPSWPSVSPDGEWVYFSGVEGFENYKLWRIRLDGSAVERVSGADSTLEWRGDVSRTGNQLVFVTNLSFFALRDLDSGTATPLPLGGQVPHFSPVDDKIAFLTASPTGNIAIMDPDGSNVVPLTTTADYGEGLDWSSDGQWIVAERGHGLELIEVATGTRIPLQWADGLAQPSWRPE
jgi:hypothetical protein